MRDDATIAGLTKRNGQLYTILSEHCPEALKIANMQTGSWHPLSKIHHLLEAALRGRFDRVKELADQINIDFKTEYDERSKRKISDEHLEKMQAGRKFDDKTD